MGRWKYHHASRRFPGPQGKNKGKTRSEYEEYKQATRWQGARSRLAAARPSGVLRLRSKGLNRLRGLQGCLRVRRSGYARRSRIAARMAATTSAFGFAPTSGEHTSELH